MHIMCYRINKSSPHPSHFDILVVSIATIIEPCVCLVTGNLFSISPANTPNSGRISLVGGAQVDFESVEAYTLNIMVINNGMDARPGACSSKDSSTALAVVNGLISNTL